MKGRNILLSKMKKTLLIICVILISTITQVYATETTENENGTESSEPYIEMKVTSRKKGENNQILVEMYGSKFKDLQAIETVFTYDSTKLTPSNIETNEPLDLTTIKYDQRPAYYEKPITDAEQNEVDNFNKESLNILSNSYTTNTNYSEQLGVSAFLFLAPNENTEALQFLLKNKKSTPNITSEEKVLLGTFSFTQTAGTKIEENEFSVRRIKISCLDLNSEDGIAQYERSKIVEDKIPSDKCEELMEFKYEQYGSISGTINISTRVKKTKKIATIKVFEKSRISAMNFDDLKNYETNRKNLLETLTPDYSYITKEEDNGVFKIENIVKGEYIVLIDKQNFLDYVITGIVIEGTNDNVNLNEVVENLGEEFVLLPGDVNKNGKVTVTDKNEIDKAYKATDKTDRYDINDDNKLTVTDKNIMDVVYKDKDTKNKKMRIVKLNNN